MSISSDRKTNDAIISSSETSISAFSWMRMLRITLNDFKTWTAFYTKFLPNKLKYWTNSNTTRGGYAVQLEHFALQVLLFIVRWVTNYCRVLGTEAVAYSPKLLATSSCNANNASSASSPSEAMLCSSGPPPGGPEAGPRLRHSRLVGLAVVGPDPLPFGCPNWRPPGANR